MSDNYFEQLGARVGSVIGEGPDEARRAQQKRALLQDPPRRRALPRLALAGAAAGVALCAVLWWLLSPSPLDYRVGGGALVKQGLLRTGTDESVPIDFDDGSQVELRGQTTAQVVESSRRRVQIALRRGTLDARVRSRFHTRYHVTAGPFRVQDVGTVFEVSWDPEDARLTVEVSEGRVNVGGGALSQKGVQVEAGTRLEVSGGHRVTLSRPKKARPPGRPHEPAGKTAIKPAEPPAEPPSVPDEPHDFSGGQAPPPPPPAPARVRPRDREVPKTPAWRQAYDEGDYHAAIQRARTEGLARLARSAGSDDLWKLASAARYRRDGAAARLLLKAIRKRFSRSRRARTAAYLLGRVSIELSGDPRGAIRWFKIYLEEDPRGPLTEEAHGRLIIACQRAGLGASAKARARRYLSRYGDGLYHKIARAVLEGRHP